MSPALPSSGSWGIMGGIFDPIHYGHLILAESALEGCGFSGVLFVPSFNPPHREQKPEASFEDRCRMVQLAIEGHDRFLSSDFEKDLKSPGYTLAVVDFLKLKSPEVTWNLILGADNIAQFDHWHSPEELVKRVKIFVGNRPGYDHQFQDSRWAEQVVPFEMPYIGLSSTQLRKQLKGGRSIRYLVPDEVRRFIESKRLYR
ncbi:putative nicotinate-nucleotide adenylyltransferase [Candidatus Zixiibacteriota bacterium]|nr:putative nicotinate-nucleotide adenylyltransferase [candidate division Zixibacteria bacterium]